MIPVEYVDLTKRGISAETCRRFKYGVGEHWGKPVQVANYGGHQKTRDANKGFAWLSRPEKVLLFGQELWKPQRKLIITEGEIDCLSYAEATECRWPVVSLPDGAGSAKRAIADNLEWVSAFDEVILLFDMDEAGQEAVETVAAILPPGKAFVGVLPCKDANETLLQKGAAELQRCAFTARPYRPDGIVEGTDLIEKVLQKPPAGLSYPWPALDGFLHGQRRGEMVTWVAGTGVGKSQVLREVARHLWTNHKERVGIIALEESNQDSALGQLSLELGVRMHIPAEREAVPESLIRAAADRVLPGFAFYDHWGSVEAKVLLPKIRYMAHGMGIRWIVLDHLSIMVSGMAAEGDERKRLDQLTTQLRGLCSELDIGLHIVSHLRKADGTPHEEGGRVTLQQIRGSGAPAQLSNMVIALERNQQADGQERNVTTLRVLKNRLTGETGVAGRLLFNPVTNRIETAPDVEEERPVFDPPSSDKRGQRDF